jgi:hypothetical protein
MFSFIVLGYLHFDRIEVNSLKRNGNYMYKTQTPWPLVRKGTIPTERSPLVDEIIANFVDRLSRGQRGGFPTAVNLSFLDRSRYFTFK